MDVPSSFVVDGEHTLFVGVDGARRPTLKISMLIFVWSIGLAIGFDFGITGNLLSMPAFLEEYFPNAYKNMIISNHPLGDFYSNLYRSCSYLVAFVSAYTITIFRIRTHAKMRIGGCIMSIGMLISSFAINTALITCGRILLGISIGHGYACIAPSTYRRRVPIWFSHGISLGILMAKMWFFAIKASPARGRVLAIWGSLSLSIVLLVFSVSCALSLGHEIKLLFDDSSEVVDKYLKTIGPTRYEAARSLIQQIEISPISIIFERKYIPPLVAAICVSIFQQFTGVYALMIYAPVLFKTMGLDERASFLCSYTMYMVNVFMWGLTTTPTEKFERRRSMFMQGGIAMLICLIIIVLILGVRENLGALPWWIAALSAVAVVVAIWAYVGWFCWSWGQLGWLVPSEILPLKIRSIGYSICVSMNMLSMFFVTQFFTMGLCEMGIVMHVVILCLVLLMTVFVYALLPETNGVDDMEDVSKIWERFV